MMLKTTMEMFLMRCGKRKWAGFVAIATLLHTMTGAEIGSNTPSDVTVCKGATLTLTCPDDHVVVFSDIVFGTPGWSSGSSCLPSEQDCITPSRESAVAERRVQCLWQLSECSVEMGFGLMGVECWPSSIYASYITATDFFCAPNSDHHEMHKESTAETIQAPEHSTIYVTSYNHPVTYGTSAGETRHVVNVKASAGRGLVLNTLYPINLAPRHNGSCSETSLWITSDKRQEQTTRQYCQDDEIDQGILTDNGFEVVSGWQSGGEKHYRGFALRIESCRLAMETQDISVCQSQPLCLSCPTDHVVAGLVYAGTPGLADGNECTATPGDCQGKPLNEGLGGEIERCVWQRSECVLRMRRTQMSGCGSLEAGYLLVTGFTCVPLSETYVMSSKEQHVTVPSDGSPVYIVTPNHPKPYSSHENFTSHETYEISLETSGNHEKSNVYGLRVQTLYQPSMPPSCSEGSLQVWEQGSELETSHALLTVCGSSEFNFELPVGQARLIFRTGSGAEAYTGVALRVTAYLVGNTPTGGGEGTSPTPSKTTAVSPMTVTGDEDDDANYLVSTVVLGILLFVTLVCFVAYCVFHRRDVVYPTETGHPIAESGQRFGPRGSIGSARYFTQEQSQGRSYVRSVDNRSLGV